MAEGLVRHEAADRYEAFSAGTHPSQVRSEAVVVMRELGVDISAQRSKPLQEFEDQQFGFLQGGAPATLCDTEAPRGAPLGAKTATYVTLSASSGGAYVRPTYCRFEPAFLANKRRIC
jgi:hypothetical protein